MGPRKIGPVGLDLSGLGGQGEPGESHQESVTNNQTDNQANIEPFQIFVNQRVSIG